MWESHPLMLESRSLTSESHGLMSETHYLTSENAGLMPENQTLTCETHALISESRSLIYGSARLPKMKATQPGQHLTRRRSAAASVRARPKILASVVLGRHRRASEPTVGPLGKRGF